MEHAQGDAVGLVQLVKQLDQRDLGAVQLPVAGEDAACLLYTSRCV